MKWKNLGIIFGKEDLKNIDKDIYFAKSPQTIVKKNSVIVYFTSQKKDKNNKWVSLPYFVEYSKDFSSILNFSKSPILDKGALGTYDEHGIFPFSPSLINSKIYAFITGWSRRSSVDIEMSIGIAKSDDGYKFERLYEGPILTSSLDEPFLVGDAFVRRYNEKLHMWYIYGDKWVNEDNHNDNSNPERSYRISYASSIDGLKWHKESRYIIDKVIENECQALPSVVFHNNRYHLIFCYRNIFDFRNNKENSYKLGYASSIDLKSWKRNDDCISSIKSGSWDENMQCYPHFCEVDDQLYCLYNGNEFGKAGFGIAKLEE